jgi:hypothetical protein
VPGFALVVVDRLRAHMQELVAVHLDVMVDGLGQLVVSVSIPSPKENRLQ